MKRVVAGDVIRVTSLMTSGNAKIFVILNSFSVVRNYTYILHTPLSLQTLPKDLTMRSFERYIAPVRCLNINYPEPNSSVLQTTVNRSDLVSSSSENLSFPSFKSSSDNSFIEKRLYPYLLLFILDTLTLPLIQTTINRCLPWVRCFFRFVNRFCSAVCVRLLLVSGRSARYYHGCTIEERCFCAEMHRRREITLFSNTRGYRQRDYDCLLPSSLSSSRPNRIPLETALWWSSLCLFIRRLCTCLVILDIHSLRQ